MSLLAVRLRKVARAREKEASARLRRLEGGALRAIREAWKYPTWSWMEDLRRYLGALKPDALRLLAEKAEDERVREAAVRLRDRGR